MSLNTWDCTTCPMTRSAPCGKPNCSGHLIDPRDFKHEARKIETEWK